MLGDRSYRNSHAGDLRADHRGQGSVVEAGDGEVRADPEAATPRTATAMESLEVMTASGTP